MAPVVLLALAGIARAAHPLISEDTGTQGKGNFELELGTSLSPSAGGDLFELDPQLSYGARDDLDLIARPSIPWLRGAAAQEAGRHSGFGATALDVKWRAPYEGDVTLGVRAGLDVPAATRGLGPRKTGAHAIGVLTYAANGTLATANLAYARLPNDDGSGNRQRQDVARVSAAFVREVHADVRLAIEAAAFRDPDPSVHAWPAVVLFGAIAHVPAGFDVDVGYQARLDRAAPSDVWLAGLTLRW